VNPPAVYAIALGSNRRGAHGAPRAEVAAALDLLDGLASPIIASAPLGPSTRTFANAVALVASALDPPAMLARLKAIEHAFGRRGGRRWGARVLDLDIVLWSGGHWTSRALAIPHPAYPTRGFVLTPLRTIAPRWRDPRTGLTIRHLHARLTRARPVPSPTPA
jgi:2-amino-4-hydroxy-6-hydroxymethyldihydropteridine diphosphokinase